MEPNRLSSCVRTRDQARHHNGHDRDRPRRHAGMLIRQLHKLGRRANVSVEFALISVFVLLPLFSGGANFMEIICAQSQLNTALQSLYYFAWANPSIATNTSDVAEISTLINTQSLNQIKLSSATITYGCTSPSSSIPTYSTNPCSSKPWLAISLQAVFSCRSPYPSA
jgi:hypothetical protein